MILFPECSPAQPESFDEYCAAGGYDALKKSLPPPAILREIPASGLRGRGGAVFPAGRKWAVAAETPATPRYVVCNAGEDEPGSLKDRILIAHRPHLVLEGTILAARAIQAGHAYIYLNETYDDCFNRMDEAVREATAAGLLGSLAVTIHRAPTVYVAGEDSAAIEVLEGKPPLPRQKPPYPAASGLVCQPAGVDKGGNRANVPPSIP